MYHGESVNGYFSHTGEQRPSDDRLRDVHGGLVFRSVIRLRPVVRQCSGFGGLGGGQVSHDAPPQGKEGTLTYNGTTLPGGLIISDGIDIEHVIHL
jgi:hypothetical protein